MLVLSMLASGKAFAQCTPDPVQAGQAVTCSGAVNDGYVLMADNAPLSLTSGGALHNTGDALTVSIPAANGYIARSATLTIGGTVSSDTGSGIAILSGPAMAGIYDVAGTYAQIVVNAGGSVSGATAVTMARSAGLESTFAEVVVNIDNSGTLSGSSGIAITSGVGSHYGAIANLAGGYIGAISAPFLSIANSGTIDGGTLSAVSWDAYISSTIGNDGVIRSNSAAATIDVRGAAITNSGTIANSGGGAAIVGATSITNQAGGVISANGSTAISGQYVQVTNAGTIAVSPGDSAISVSGTLTLTNTGTVTGNVRAVEGSVIDSTKGAINGDVSFTADYGTLVATLDNGVLHTGVAGAINTTGSRNRISIATAQDVSLASPLDLPAGFQLLALNPAANTTLTLVDGFSTNTSIEFTGLGTLANATSLSGTGTIVTGDFFAGNLVNSGSIDSANAAGPAALVLSGYSTLTNTGQITASGDALGNGANGLDNSGSIVAGGTAAMLFTSTGTFRNSGTIISTGGTAVSLSQSCTCSSSSNSGTISGAQVGLALGDGIILNTGTISSPGVGIALQYYGTVQNQPGGVISGGAMAIGSLGGAPGGSSVVNAGTIRGNVNLANAGFSTNSYVALPGGVLDGNLTLGNGDTLVTQLANSGPGQFAGVLGTVTADRSILVYNVGADASPTAGTPAGFASIGYQLSGNATLTLSDSGTSALKLAGTGSVVSNGAISTSNASALASQPVVFSSDNSQTALAITNNGSLATTRADPSAYFGSTVNLLPGDSLTNTGIISWGDTSGAAYGVGAAVSGGATIVNNGTITATGGNGVVIGNYYATSTPTLTNRGTIQSSLAAVSFGGAASVTNSGDLTSRGGPAIAGIGYGYYAGGPMTVTNLAGGTITGVGDAINLSGGTVSNAGTINGNVNLGPSANGFSWFGPGTYVAAGGTLNGDLIFSNDSGGNQLIETGSGFGITGTISARTGMNYLGHLRTASGTVTLGGELPAGFTREFVVASGSAARVTVSGAVPEGTAINVGGDGNIINQVDTTGALGKATAQSLSIYPGGLYDSTLQLASLTNQASVGSINAYSNALVNTGTVGGADHIGIVVSQNATGAFNFTNSGSILSRGTIFLNFQYIVIQSAIGLSGELSVDSKITNTGTIAGGLTGSFKAGPDADGQPLLSISNSGTISGVSRHIGEFQFGIPAVAIYPLSDYSQPVARSVDVNLVNSGTIAGDIVLEGSHNTLVNTASGSIVGNVQFSSSSAGSNSVNLAGAFAGSIAGGAGTTMTVSGGSATAPIAFTSLTDIDNYHQTAGFTTISHNAVVTDMAIDGGRLVGLIGSTITSPAIVVGANGTFGSGGTVNGNITVNGTLRPGASPDAMTVNGNVMLAAGSTAAFEVTPTAHSTLLVTGAVTIAPGATLRLVPTGRVLPGTRLALISASDGITGSFSALVGMGGKLIPQTGGIDIFTLFDQSIPQSGQVRRGIAYVNGALAAGTLSVAMTAAIPHLVSADGTPDSQAFARLAAEPYASAMQIGVETALGLADASRRILVNPGKQEGRLFTFAQALGGWNDIAGDAGMGTSGATLNGYGLLGGLGISGSRWSIAAFGGYSRQDQTIAPLGAATKADGFVGGVTARFNGHRFDLSVTAAYDAAWARTRRLLPDDALARSGYGLHTWLADGQLSGALSLGQHWVARPQIGMTWVWTTRGSISEIASGPFASTLAEGHHRAGFIDGGVSFQPAPAAGSSLRPHLDMGMRWQFDGRATSAISGFADLPVALRAAGLRRSAASALIGIGADYAITPLLTLFLAGHGQLADGTHSTRLQGGVSARF
jgi:hypothetical protein